MGSQNRVSIRIAICLAFWVFGCHASQQTQQEAFVSRTLLNARRIIYVSPTGNENGNGSKSRPLESIQEAIHMAQKGDVIQVEPGTYTENITLRSHIKLVGAGADVTFLTAEQGNLLTAHNTIGVIIEGFTLDGKDRAEYGLFCRGQQIYSLSQRIPPLEFRKNTVKNLLNSGIDAEYTVITIEDNTLISILTHGIHLFRCRSTIKNNRVSLTKTGIRHDDHRAKIIGNFVSQSGYGIYCHGISSSTVTNNVVSQAGEYGIFISVSSLIVQSNEVTDSQFGMGFTGAGYTKIRRNRITGNKQYGVFIWQNAVPDLGREDDFGYNAIWNNGTHDIYSESEASVLAVRNWWGVTSPNPNQFKGNIDYSQPLSEPPVSGYEYDVGR